MADWFRRLSHVHTERKLLLVGVYENPGAFPFAGLKHDRLPRTDRPGSRATAGTVTLERKRARTKKIPGENGCSHQNDRQCSKLLPAHALKHIRVQQLRNFLLASG